MGNLGQGTNWYNKDYAGNQLWSKQDYHRWHVATTALPVTNNNKLRLRFVFDSDDGVTKDGIAIDDIHVYDNIYGIYDGPTMSTSISQNMDGGNSWIHFLNTGKLVASINPNNQVLGNTQVQAFINPIGVRNFNGQYYHDRNLTIKPSLTQLSDSAKVRFYFLDAETEALIGASGCMSCTKPSMVTELGVSKYSDPVDSLEDGQVVNSVGSDWSYIHANRVVKVPFDKGYYAEFNVKDFSEFWLHNGGFDGNHTLPLQLLSFTATKVPGNNDVLAEWKTEAEYNVSRFEIELAKGLLEYQQNTFTKIGEVVSQGNSTSEQSYSFIDNEANKTGVRYYRLRIVNMNGSHSYSSVRPVIFTDDMKWQVFPNPSSGIFSLLFQLNQGEKVDINVYDATGRLVHKTSTIATGFVQRANLYLESANYIPGLYLVEATAGKNKKTFKVVKH